MKMKTEYTLNNPENRIVVDDRSSPMYTTFTRGTPTSLYAGDSLHEAAQSLGLDCEALDTELMGDGFVLAE
jgi:hypothetical protein